MQGTSESLLFDPSNFNERPAQIHEIPAGSTLYRLTTDNYPVSPLHFGDYRDNNRYTFSLPVPQRESFFYCSLRPIYTLFEAIEDLRRPAFSDATVHSNPQACCYYLSPKHFKSIDENGRDIHVVGQQIEVLKPLRLFVLANTNLSVAGIPATVESVTQEGLSVASDVGHAVHSWTDDNGPCHGLLYRSSRLQSAAPGNILLFGSRAETCIKSKSASRLYYEEGLEFLTQALRDKINHFPISANPDYKLLLIGPD